MATIIIMKCITLTTIIITIEVPTMENLIDVGKRNFSKKRYGYQAIGMMGIG
tara:strand:+ start:280 stop:435 length:156 start_codon:yes stop_codon:yes gene_type:complete